MHIPPTRQSRLSIALASAVAVVVHALSIISSQSHHGIEYATSPSLSSRISASSVSIVAVQTTSCFGGAVQGPITVHVAEVPAVVRESVVITANLAIAGVPGVCFVPWVAGPDNGSSTLCTHHGIMWFMTKDLAVGDTSSHQSKYVLGSCTPACQMQCDCPTVPHICKRSSKSFVGCSCSCPHPVNDVTNAVLGMKICVK